MFIFIFIFCIALHLFYHSYHMQPPPMSPRDISFTGRRGKSWETITSVDDAGWQQRCKVLGDGRF